MKLKINKTATVDNTANWTDCGQFLHFYNVNFHWKHCVEVNKVSLQLSVTTPMFQWIHLYTQYWLDTGSFHTSAWVLLKCSYRNRTNLTVSPAPVFVPDVQIPPNCWYLLAYLNKLHMTLNWRRRTHQTVWPGHSWLKSNAIMDYQVSGSESLCLNFNPSSDQIVMHLHFEVVMRWN